MQNKKDHEWFQRSDFQLSIILVGVKLSEVYESAVEVIRNDKPGFVDKLTKNAGYVSLKFK